MTHYHPRSAMAKSAKPSERPKTKTVADKVREPQPPRDTDDDYEDGDIATPKRDRYGNDDEPL
ncbi:hypothetical protein XH80_07620 [Bradyrhizobium sp. CCBAU 45384]|nr:hypothetical protein [Bradyrhizobium sp. CCBAU 45384]